MKEITITVKPTLEDISDPKRLVDKLTGVISIIEDNLTYVSEDVAEELLRMAKENARNGYRGIPYGNENWADRDPITKLLYELSPYHTSNLPGLDTGARRLIESLERGGQDNIFNISGLEVTIGTRFKHAKLLEEGGLRRTAPNIGFTREGNPNRWLSRAIDQGLISEAEVQQIRQKFMTPRMIEPRPFLRPAKRFMEDSGVHMEKAVQTLRKEIEDELMIRADIKVRGDSVNVPT